MKTWLEVFCPEAFRNPRADQILYPSTHFSESPTQSSLAKGAVTTSQPQPCCVVLTTEEMGESPSNLLEYTSI